VSNTLSLAMLIAAYAQDTDEAVLLLLTITHPELPEPWRFVLNGENITSRGEVYYASYFDLILPDDSGDRPPQANLTFPNVNRLMTELLEASIQPATITIEIILASAPDVVELEFPSLQMQPGTKYNAKDVNSPLAGRRTAREGFPKGIISPSYFQGAF